MTTLVMYTGVNCSRCEQAKQIFDSQGIPYQAIDVNATPEAREMLVEKNLRQLPVINDNGNWHTGFDRNILSSILSTRMGDQAQA